MSPGSGWQLCHLPGTRGPWGQSPVLPAALGVFAGGCHSCPQMSLSIPQCSQWSHLCDLRDRKDPGCGPAREEPAVGMESRLSFAAPSLA